MFLFLFLFLAVMNVELVTELTLKVDPAHSSIYICLPGETHLLRLMSIWLDYNS